MTDLSTQSIDHSITYSVITSSADLPYSSVLSSIRLHSVTAGDFADSTYIEWDARFSSDATAGQSSFLSVSVPFKSLTPVSPEVISDAKYKRIEALLDLQKTVVSS